VLQFAIMDEEEEDLYALLNVPRHASREEIKASYVSLARLLHPDKSKATQVDESRTRDEALELFLRVDRAYKVLADDSRRRIYDAYGLEGLKALQAIDMESRKRTLHGLKKEDEDYLSENLPLAAVDERGEVLRRKVLGRVKLERDLLAQQRFNVKGVIQTNIRGQGLLANAFEPPSEYDLYDGKKTFQFEAPSITSMVVSQSIDASLGDSDVFTLGAQVLVRGNVGAHSMTLSHEHTFSTKLNLESSAGTTSRDPLSLSIKANRVLDQYTKGSLEFALRDHFHSGLNVSAARKLTDTITGVLQLGFGIEEGLLLQLQHSSRTNPQVFRSKRAQEEEFFRDFYGGSSAETQERQAFHSQEEHEGENIDRTATFLSNGNLALFMNPTGVMGLDMNWTKSITKNSSGRIGFKLSSRNLELDLTSSKVIGEHSKGSVSLGIGLLGVKLTLRFDRGGMRYIFPISLSSKLSFGAAVVGGCVPAAVNYSISQMLLPFQRRRKGRLGYELAVRGLEAREKAKRQQNIIEKAAERRVKQAGETNGLVILRARYGTRLQQAHDWRPVEKPKLEDFVQREASRPRLPSDWDLDDDVNEQDDIQENEEQVEFESDDTDDESSMYKDHPPNIDVTIPLNYLCKETTLELHGGATKSQLLGFYNPCLIEGVEPELYIRYSIGSWIFELTVDDIEPVKLPSIHAVVVGNQFDRRSVEFA